MGLAAGRYSGSSRPERYRTPQALHSVFGPNGPSLHCGVLVTSQCVHFLNKLESMTLDCCDNFLLFFSFPFLASEFFLAAKAVQDAGAIKIHGFKVDDRARLERRPLVPKLEDVLFPPEQELLCSRTEIGLCVWNRTVPWASGNSF